MSVIKRLGNVAKGTLKTWTRASEESVAPESDARRAAEEELRRLEAEARNLEATERPLDRSAPAPAPVTDPWAARRQAIAQAFAAGVLTPEERDEKLTQLEAEVRAAERGDPPPPKKRSL